MSFISREYVRKKTYCLIVGNVEEDSHAERGILSVRVTDVVITLKENTRQVDRSCAPESKDIVYGQSERSHIY